LKILKLFFSQKKIMSKEEIEEIQQELKQLTQKHLEIERTHQKQFFLYRWLQPDPELQSVKDEIARLDARELEYFKILQVPQRKHI
jgi:hypothetical protein